MKITDIILVSENWKGTETNFLMTIADYMNYVDMDMFDSRKDVAYSMIELGRTLENENVWSELYFAGNKSVAARFCVDDRQLMKFLKGFYDSTDQEVLFDEERCSDECMNKLAELGMDTRGKVSTGSLYYTKLDTVFEQGQTLRNFNGHDYRVMEKLSEKNLLLMDTMTGSFVVAQRTDLFARHPRGVEPTEENSLIGIEWGHGLYLSSTPSAIDFRLIRQEYGTEKKIEDIYQYREMLQDRFYLYSRLEKDNVISDALKGAVMYASFDEFGTSDPEEFKKSLNAGLYDKGFAKIGEVKQEKSR
ncbi:MAG: hypothetical protein J6D08_18160 [Lachnospiraceae bacterium]|nr:hypothetical protein [Lachnospiraceae bacterium]